MSKRFESFVGMISSLSKEITRLKNEEMRRFGLNGTDGMCLYYLAKRPEGVTSAELARMMGVDRAVVSRALTRLDAGEYVAINGSDDGRAGRFVSLTDKGLTVTREVDQVLADIVERAGRGVEGPDRDAMYDMMQAILSNLREI
ncbi:MarR family winged helix-turn-helix transcriptional regulator [Olsenella intestinalis]|uniref:MarR family winged helix-turn-helix transcriptional regulator n=1 Tax=Olsenella intestinalis TaxID=2930083 RepID=UPI00200DDC2E